MNPPVFLLGLADGYDSAAVLLRDGQIVAAAQEERFTRRKHDGSFPIHAVRYVLDAGGIALHEVTALAQVPPTDDTDLDRSLPSILLPGQTRPPVHTLDHHCAHAAAAFYPSPFADAAVLTLDGRGETIGKGEDERILTLRSHDTPNSLGRLYSAVTAHCGFKPNGGEYKLMGLAPYGDPDSPRTRGFEAKIRDHLIWIEDDGSYRLNPDPVDWTALFTLPPRAPESGDPEQSYCDMALAIQRVTEDVMLRLAQTARTLTGSGNLCLSGGLALNCVANGKILRAKLFDHIWIQPAAGNAGAALGAALALWHGEMARPRRCAPKNHDAMQGSTLGPSFTDDAITAVLHRFQAPSRHFTAFSDLCAEVSDLLSAGQVVGWFQGRMEFGPRALGNRSILGDPRRPEMQKHLNLKIKYREGFRPFAPSVLAEETGQYFELEGPSPYMLLVAPVATSHRFPLPDGYEHLPLWDRLYHPRSDLPAITHVDYSARVQSVSRESNPRYWQLLKIFQERHGCPVLVNTSFNVRGEPIVCTPEDAYRCFMGTEMDVLVLGDRLLHKTEQPPLQDDRDWREYYPID